MAVYSSKNLVYDFIMGYGTNNYLDSSDWSIANYEAHLRQAKTEIDAALGQSFTVLSTTAIMAMTTAAANMFASVTTNPTTAKRIVTIVRGGTTGSGSVVFTGTVDTIAGDTETITFSGSSVEFTYRPIKTLTALTTTGLHDEASIPTVGLYQLECPDIIVQLGTMYTAWLMLRNLDRSSGGKSLSDSLGADVKSMIEGLLSGDIGIIDPDGSDVLLDDRSNMYRSDTVDEAGKDIKTNFSGNAEIEDGLIDKDVADL